MVQERLTVFLKSQGEIFDAVEPLFDDVNRRQQVVELAADLAARWPDLEPATKRRIFKRLVNRINLTQETLEIRIAPGRLLEILWEEDNPKTFEPALWDNELTVTFTVPAHLKRVGMETRLLIEGADGSARKSPDRSLLRLLSPAQRFHEMVLHNRGRTMTELAIEAGVGGVLLHPDPAPQLPRAGGREDHPPGPPSARADRQKACRRHAPANRMGRTARPVSGSPEPGYRLLPDRGPSLTRRGGGMFFRVKPTPIPADAVSPTRV